MALRLECRYAVTLLLLSLPLPLPLPVSPRPQTPVPGSSPCHPLVFRPSCPALSIHQFLGERFCPFLVCALALRSRSPPALSFSLLCSVDSALGLSRWLSRSVGRSVDCLLFFRSFPQVLHLDRRAAGMALRLGRGCALTLVLLCLPLASACHPLSAPNPVPVHDSHFCSAHGVSPCGRLPGERFCPSLPCLPRACCCGACPVAAGQYQYGPPNAPSRPARRSWTTQRELHKAAMQPGLLWVGCSHARGRTAHCPVWRWYVGSGGQAGGAAQKIRLRGTPPRPPATGAPVSTPQGRVGILFRSIKAHAVVYNGRIAVPTSAPASNVTPQPLPPGGYRLAVLS